MSFVVSDLFIYPIKSIAGIALQTGRVLNAGFEHDRRWMLVDDRDVFITQRDQPKLSLFIPEIIEDRIKITYGNHSMNFGVNEGTNQIVNTKVWDDYATTILVKNEASLWFSEMLNKKVNLVRIKDDLSRNHYNTAKKKEITVSLADGYPYLLVGTQSLDSLNSKLKQPIEMSRFRPNIVVTTKIAHEEDEWDTFSIGALNFINLKPCGRCTVITINQNTSEINNEPLKVLNTYRKQGNNVLFGTNIMSTKEGFISVGDIVKI